MKRPSKLYPIDFQTMMFLVTCAHILFIMVSGAHSEISNCQTISIGICYSPSFVRSLLVSVKDSVQKSNSVKKTFEIFVTLKSYIASIPHALLRMFSFLCFHFGRRSTNEILYSHFSLVFFSHPSQVHQREANPNHH